MKNQKSVKTASEIVSDKSAAAPSAESGEIVKFDEAGMPQLEVWLENETVWLTQNQMADLFGCAVANINMHLKNIYTDGELEFVLRGIVAWREMSNITTSTPLFQSDSG